MSTRNCLGFGFQQCLAICPHYILAWVEVRQGWLSSKADFPCFYYEFPCILNYPLRNKLALYLLTGWWIFPKCVILLVDLRKFIVFRNYKSVKVGLFLVLPYNRIFLEAIEKWHENIRTFNCMKIFALLSSATSRQRMLKTSQVLVETDCLTFWK